MESALLSGGKHNPSDSINDKRKIFDTKILEGWRTLTNWGIEKGDEVFLRFHYVDSMSSYMAANKLTTEFLASGR